MKLLLTSLLVFSKVSLHQAPLIYRVKWPVYEQKDFYPKPVRRPDYCRANLCPAKISHLTCESKFWGPKCGDDHNGVMLKHQKAKILRSINIIRLNINMGHSVLPKSKKCSSLLWDETLATMAMRVTNQCNEEPAELCVNTLRFRDVGENSDTGPATKSSKPDLAAFILKWVKAGEKDLASVDLENFPADQPKNVMLVANMIYEQNKYVGCGMLKSKSKWFVTCLFNKKIRPGVKLYTQA